METSPPTCVRRSSWTRAAATRCSTRTTVALDRLDLPVRAARPGRSRRARRRTRSDRPGFGTTPGPLGDARPVLCAHDQISATEPRPCALRAERLAGLVRRPGGEVRAPRLAGHRAGGGAAVLGDRAAIRSSRAAARSARAGFRRSRRCGSAVARAPRKRGAGDAVQDGKRVGPLRRAAREAGRCQRARRQRSLADGDA